MRGALVIVGLLACLAGNSQLPYVNFARIDDRAQYIDANTPQQLAWLLTKDYHTDIEKTRSIFSWITSHITYRVRRSRISISTNRNQDMPEDTAKWQSANERMAEMVLQSRTAVCDGYARLFTALCNYAGIRSAIITGFAKTDLPRRAPFKCNHTWNAVFINNSWQLLDLTWASGYTSYRGDEFFRRQDERYFLAEPASFFSDHFPDDLRWALMDKIPPPHEFNSSPYFNKPFGKYQIAQVSPFNGIIEAAPGDTIHIELLTRDPVADRKMAPDTLAEFDTSQEKISSSVAVLEPENNEGDRKNIRYSFFVIDESVEWLQVQYNHDAVLRYHLRIKKDKNALAAGTGITRPGAVQAPAPNYDPPKADRP